MNTFKFFHECPLHHGFCLKFYDKERLTRDDAEQICQRDGGHLVNVNSEMKVKDVNETILQQNFDSNRIWIDGRKSVQGDPWTYGYKSSDPSFTFWGDDDPDNGRFELCIVYFFGLRTNYLWRWLDFPCDAKFAFICQYK
ncbi:C-type lectin-like [Ruditapes philippinarum]|uniref:C-type lectin-like n=1 Tax=Ruditapes philippinarum TaxID=129788 RepID=UPI00295C374F|nr:C-type lectin-like [Ruditapes philippinarum]